MESTVSVSKGCFVYKGASSGKKRKSSQKHPSMPSRNLIIPQKIRCSQWYLGFEEFWEKIDKRIEHILHESYSNVMENVLECVRGANSSAYTYLFPVIVLQTGINQPDHLNMFRNLSQRISGQDHLYSVMLTSTEATSVKVAIESLVGGFLDHFRTDNEVEIKKSCCTMRSLCGDFREGEKSLENDGRILAVVIPDFELFCKPTLCEIIAILASYRQHLPLVLIFGVATSISSLEQLLPLKFTTRAKFHVFRIQSSVSILNQMVENVLLEERILLSGRVLQFLVEKFLFYDFSISGFIQGVKFCLLDQFSQGNLTASVALKRLEVGVIQEDCENIRRLMSVRRHIENLSDSQRIILLLTNDAYLEETVRKVWIPQIEEFLLHFQSALHFVHELVGDLPKSPLGKQLREIFCFCSINSTLNTDEYTECRQILSVMSKDAFTKKLSDSFERIEHFLRGQKVSKSPKVVQGIQVKFQEILESMRRILTESAESKEQTVSRNNQEITTVTNRYELQKMLLEKAKDSQRVTERRDRIPECLKVLEERLLSSWLVPFSRGPPLIELFIYTDASSARRHLMGSPRGALHQALNNPQHYFQCQCCESTSLSSNFPDLTIAYKLYAECGRMINLFDWLQAFHSIITSSNDADEEGQINPQIQARFTRAVCELEFLGFIKSSKRKVDHVEKLTW
ncbi:Origin recognition complex subunit 3 [Sergentomyia squamirostris]